MLSRLLGDKHFARFWIAMPRSDVYRRRARECRALADAASDLRADNTICSSLSSGTIWPERRRNTGIAGTSGRHGWQFHRVPDMKCPICEVVVSNAVMSCHSARAFIAAPNAASISSSAVQHMSDPFVKSSIGPITFPEVASGGNRLDTWSLLRIAARQTNNALAIGAR